MPYAVNLIADDPDGRIADLWSALAAFSEPPAMPDLNYPPHITLLRCEDVDVTDLQVKVAGIASALSEQQIHFPSFACFTEPEFVLWAAPAPSAALIRLHQDLIETCGADKLHPHTQPGVWQPHCSVAINVPAANRIAALTELARMWRPLNLRFHAIDCVRFHPVERQFSVPLSPA